MFVSDRTCSKFLPFAFYNFSELNIHDLYEIYTQRYML